MAISSISGQASPSRINTPYSKTTLLQPHFGFQRRQHRLIDDATISSLKPSSLKNLLTDHDNSDQLGKLSYQLDQDDIQTHFVNIETRGEDIRIRAIDSPISTIEALIAKISFQPKKQINWPAIQRLTSRRDEQEGNLVLNGYNAYNDLIDAFKRNDSIAEILRKTAKLLHYTGDICQPLHVTAFFTWKLKYPIRNKEDIESDMHSFIEGRTMVFPLPETETRLDAPLTENRIKSRLIEEARHAYQQGTQIRRIDLLAQNLGLYKYSQTLQTRLAPIIEEQMTRASKLGSELLWSCYLAAGQPNLQNPHTDSLGGKLRSLPKHRS